MNAFIVMSSYVRWHYGKGLKDLINNWKIFIVFLAGFFSLEILFGTLFSPWERMSEGYQRGLKPGIFFETLLVNSIMRIFGFIVRCSVLIIGFLTISLCILIGIIVLLFWILSPAIVMFLLALSIRYFFS